ALEEQRLLTCSNGRWQLGNINAAGAYPPIPELVRQVIESRLEQLDSETQHLLQLAAVIGHDVPIDLLHSLAGMDRNAFASGITHAIESHFIVESNEGHSLRFNHALVREV